MEKTADIPPDVLRFIEAHVASVEQLEILRILGEAPDREWHQTHLAEASQMETSALAEQLARLEERGLVSTRTGEDGVLCRLDPRPASTAIQLGKLLQVYNERPVTLINFLYTRAQDGAARRSSA